ncbi:MAG: hypothetical protein B6A08_06195 [Sorangiineae bacterium NIC37A_2]|jgi:hemoglobin|nr:MAG: hypothetical protein B6A08_06195 [Sorangiineae bacterium NIC37A_2]
MESFQMTGGGTKPQLDSSLYKRLGGAPTLRLFTTALVSRVFSDPLLQPFFYGTNPVPLIDQLEKFLCVLTGGPGSWRGPSPQGVVAGFAVTPEHFDRLMFLVTAVADEMDLGATGALPELKDCLLALEPYLVNSSYRPTLPS